MPGSALTAKGKNSKKRMAASASYTVADFNREFRDDDLCLEYVKEQCWPAGIRHCVKCGGPRKHYRVTGRTAYACILCGNHIYPLAETLFAKSTTPLKTWFYAIYVMVSTGCALSARQLQREIGVTYKTAWRLSRSIRQLMAPDDLYRESSLSPLEASSKGGDHGVALGDHGRPPVGKTNRYGSTTVRALSSGGSVADGIT
jgi:transposase